MVPASSAGGRKKNPGEPRERGKSGKYQRISFQSDEPAVRIFRLARLAGALGEMGF